MKKWAIWFGFFAVVTLCIMLGIFFGVNSYILSIGGDYSSDISALPKSDVILILGARVYSDGTPSPALRDRLDYGFEAYKNGVSSKILCSGDNGKIEYNEVIGMQNYLVKLGVPREDVILDYAGFDTYDSIYRARDVFCVGSMVVITQEYHLPRALYIAEKLGVSAYGFSAPNSVFGDSLSTNQFRESLARLKAFIDVDVLKSKPKFLGEKLPFDK